MKRMGGAAIAAAMGAFALMLPLAAPATAEEASRILAQSAPAGQFTDERLVAFAAAAKGVYAIRQKYAPQFQAAADDNEKKRIVGEARAEMEKTIADNGLTVEQYNEILLAAKEDQALAEKLGKLLGPPPSGG